MSVPNHASGNGERIMLDRAKSSSIRLNREFMNSCGFTPSMSKIPLILSLADVQINLANCPSSGIFVVFLLSVGSSLLSLLSWISLSRYPRSAPPYGVSLAQSHAY